MANEVPTKSAVSVIGRRRDQTMVALISEASGPEKIALIRADGGIEDEPTAKSNPTVTSSNNTAAHKIIVRL